MFHNGHPVYVDVRSGKALCINLTKRVSDTALWEDKVTSWLGLGTALSSWLSTLTAASTYAREATWSAPLASSRSTVLRTLSFSAISFLMVLFLSSTVTGVRATLGVLPSTRTGCCLVSAMIVGGLPAKGSYRWHWAARVPS